MTCPIVVMAVSRGRPQSVRPYMDWFFDTSEGLSKVVWCLDRDDPKLEEYVFSIKTLREKPVFGQRLDFVIKPRMGLGGSTNNLAMELVDHYQILGEVCDDFRFRTIGWDSRVYEVFSSWPDRTGLVFCNDLLQKDKLATEVFISSNLVKTMGFFALPTLRHLYRDNFYMVIGRGLGRLKYLDDVIIEHMHPLAGKASWDAGYRENNTPEMYSKDGGAFNFWLERESFNFIEQLKMKLNISYGFSSLQR